MKLTELITAIETSGIRGDLTQAPEVTGVACDSRRVAAGNLFVAVRGVNVDGHDYIESLYGRGPAAVVCERLPEHTDDSIIYVTVPDSAVALGQLASQWYGNPSRELSLLGVTGTNGKTTTATLIYEMARLSGRRAGLLSTVANYIDSEVVPATQTTPDPLTINALLRRMVDAGCSVAAMEVSSHAADQHRIAGLTFAGGIFTNLTRDHLDYHKTFDNYLRAKKSFFDHLPAGAFALTNLDDKVGEVMLQNTGASRHTYSLRAMADFRGRVIEDRLDGMLMSFNGREVETMFTGRFNAYNLTAVYGACRLLGWDEETVLLNMSRLVPVAGRFQTFRSPDRTVTAVVDYAHTPDAVVNVLQTIREVIGTGGHIITVVGAGGNRDRGKRPIMAREAARLSDSVILTSDNPRDEQPEAILADMSAGVADDPVLAARTRVLTDRAEAIAGAIAGAAAGDVVLIAGKGHEDYQEIRGVKHHFDDREVAVRCLKERG